MPQPSPNTPPQVSAESRQFLAAVGREGPFRFRALPDEAEKKKSGDYRPVELTGTFDDHSQQLRRLNDVGYGIFVQVNISDGGWKAENITGATCFYADFDGVPLEQVERLSLVPHVVVETSPGKRHFYWRVDGIDIGQHTAVQKRLIALFGSDKAVHDLPRIMRLPGFLHQKDPTSPHLVRVVETVELPPYPWGAFLDALTEAERIHGIEPMAAVRRLPASITPPGSVAPSSDLIATESMLRHLIDIALLDLGQRSEWIDAGMAIKASHGKDGFPLWVRLSSEADGFVDEDDCAKQWRTFSDDRPPEKRRTVATYFAIAFDHGWKRSLSGDIPLAEEGGKAKGGKPDAAVAIIAQAKEAGDTYFVGSDDLTYVTFRQMRADGSARTITARLNGERYRNLLAMRYYEDAVTKVAPKEQINAAIGLMEASAQGSGERRAVFLRYARHGDKIYVNRDPQDGRIVEISADGWRDVEEAPVHFVEGSRGALPVPTRGGGLESFRKHFNASEDDLVRTIAFMLSPYQQVDSFPILIAEGEPGAAKSNFGDKVLALTDPPKGSRKAGRFGEYTDERNFHVQAARCSVMFMDNISNFDRETSDQLCRLATGGSSSRRENYTMDGERQFYVARPLIVTCISTPSSRSDLLSRAMRITVRRNEMTRTEQAVWREFDRDAGEMTGVIFSCVSAALRTEAAVSAKVEAGEMKMPRMADFVQWAEAAMSALDVPSGRIASLLCDEQASMQAETARRDPIVEGLVDYFAKPGAEPINGTATQLRDKLAAASPSRVGELPHVNQFKDRLTRQAAGLLALGIKVDVRFDAHIKTNKFNITGPASESALRGTADVGGPDRLPF